VPTKPELEAELAEALARVAELEGEGSPVVAVGDLPDVSDDKEKFLQELKDMDGEPEVEGEGTYFVDVWAHRFEQDGFVRAFQWARIRGNELKGCLVFADAHELNFEQSVEPVVKKD